MHFAKEIVRFQISSTRRTVSRENAPYNTKKYIFSILTDVSQRPQRAVLPALSVIASNSAQAMVTTGGQAQDREQKPDVLDPTSAVTGLPQKRFYRQRAHSNPIADHSFD
ncbi:hypothetical protein M5D96_012927 [Drosophila gunungcola]|uniref:Uncharacterized protein n=1 Tax=Drosophila gunungcola TaxID=103775 RepID=A0A9P9YC86_9MUSC|nr:hypothetical protein M5D96_012927 [Drosophila gunungcola]